MNRLQEELLDILEVYIKLCKELGLTYFLANGSALGAVKYGGFIPWDDDIDVVMPRKDYELFCSKAKEHFPTHLFLQNYKVEKEFPFLYSKIRNSNTTFIEENVKKLDINHGIYIDIFPLDGYPDSKIEQTLLKVKLKVLRWLQFCGFDKTKPHVKLFRIFGFHKKTHKTLALYEKIVTKFNSNSALLCDYGDRQEKGCTPREYYGCGRTVMFEGLQVVVPDKIDEYLTYKYGDWRAELPIEQQQSHHITAICDLDSSYIEHIN